MICHLQQVIGAVHPHLPEQISYSPIFLNESLQLGDVLLVKFDLPLHVLKVGGVAFELELASLFVAFDLGRFSSQALLHLRRLSLINLLHLTVLVTNDRDVLLGQACLLSELVLEGQRLIHVVCLSLGLGFLCCETSDADLLSHRVILLADLLQLLLLLALFKLVSRQDVNVIFDDLLVKDLCLMDLTHQLLYSRLVVNVSLPLLLLKLRLLIP